MSMDRYRIEVASPSDSPERVRVSFDKYSEEFKTRKRRAFFSEHKNEEWFRERYEPQTMLARENKCVRLLFEGCMEM